MLWIIPIPTANTILNIAKAVVISVVLVAITRFVFQPSWALLQSDYWFVGLGFFALIIGTIFWTFLGGQKGWWKRGILSIISMCAAWSVLGMLAGAKTSDALSRGEVIADYMGERTDYSGIFETAFLEDLMSPEVREVVQHLQIQVGDSSSPFEEDDPQNLASQLEDRSPMVPGTEGGDPQYFWMRLFSEQGTTLDADRIWAKGIPAFYRSPLIRLNACNQLTNAPDYCGSLAALNAKTGLNLGRELEAHLEATGKSCTESMACRQLSAATGERFGVANDVFGETADRSEIYGNCMRWWRGDSFGCDCMNTRAKERSSAAEYSALERLYARDAAASASGRSVLTDRSTEEAAIENKIIGEAADACFPDIERIRS